MCENLSQSQKIELGVYCQVTLLPATICTIFDLSVCHLYYYLHNIFLHVDSFFAIKSKFDVTMDGKPV